MRPTLLSLLLVISFNCWSQQEDQKAIGRTIDQFFSYLSFSDSASMQLDSLQNVFTNEGKLVSLAGKKPQSFTVQQYIAGILQSLRSGELYSIQEKELVRKTDVFGKIAHVLSTYELTMKGKNGTVVRRGLNSIQLIKQDGKWLALSLIWDRETETLKLPAQYLSNN